MKWLQMCYGQVVAANKIRFLEGMKAHIISHRFFTGIGTEATYPNKGREEGIVVRQIISWKLRVHPSKYKQKGKHSEKTNIFQPSDFLLFSLWCLQYLTNKFVFLDQFFSVPAMFVLEGL